MKQTTDAEWLAVADAARIIGVTPAMVRVYANAGQLPFQRTPGGMRLFSRLDVEKFSRERQERRA
jgi:DNA-binding transcriptional MerR regulator